MDGDGLAQAEEHREQDAAVLQPLRVLRVVEHVLSQLQRQHRHQHQGHNVPVQRAHDRVGLYQQLPDAPPRLHLEIFNKILDVEIFVFGEDIQTHVLTSILQC